MFQKYQHYRSKDLRKWCLGKPCQLEIANIWGVEGNCGGEDGTGVGCHANMQALGKGSGQKADDLLAIGCAWCHDIVDGRTNVDMSREEKEWYLMRGILKTIKLAMLDGFVFKMDQS